MSSGFYRQGANVPGKAIFAGPAPSVPLPPPSSPALADTLTVHEIARQQGYTGNACTNCGGVHMQIAGHCEVCSDCGTTTGCS